MSTSTHFFFRIWRPMVILAGLVIIAYLLYAHRLGTLVPGYNPAELATYRAAGSWHQIVANPINAPFTVWLWLAVTLGHHSLLVGRIVAAAYGLLAAGLFYVIVRRWHGFRVAALSALLFATSGGLLHVARLGTPAILQVSVLLFIATIAWYRRPAEHALNWKAYCCALLFAVLWYVPGMIWFELFGLFLMRRRIIRRLSSSNPFNTAGVIFVFLLTVVPLGYAVVRSPRLMYSILGLPSHLQGLAHYASNLWHALLAIGVRSPGGPPLWVGHAPLFDIVGLALCLLGIYFYFYRERTSRSLFLGGSALISLVLISAMGDVNFASLLPLLYLFVASGLDHLLGRWLSVFPRNPVARSVGIGAVCLMLLFSVLYQTRSYFVAWPHNPATRRAFTQKNA